MKAALIGSVSSSAATLRGMLRGGLDIAGVLGLHSRHAERVSDYHDLEPIARDAGVPFAAFDKVREPHVREFLETHAADWLFVIGLSQLVPKALCELAPMGAIGFHPTPLPEGRGRAPVAWTILLNRQAAANLFFLVDEPDAGDIVEQRMVPTYPDDYARDLIDRTNVVLEQMVVDLCPAFASGNVPRTPQDHSRATFYEKRTPADGLIDWSQSVDAIHRLVRAVSHPYPGAFTHAGDRKVLIWRAEPWTQAAGEAEPGTIVALEGDLPIIQAGNGCLRCTDIEIEGGGSLRFVIGQAIGRSA